MADQALYGIALASARMDYGGEKWIALARARELVGAPLYATEYEPERDWGATITSVSSASSVAIAIGMIEKKA